MAADDIQEIKSRLDIVEIAAEYVKLKRNGQSYWGCCPFHNEKTPSFSVSQKRQSFHCFGCGKGGDIFTFIMEIEHLEFREALEKLAERAGVTLSSKNERCGAKAAIDINTAALEYFLAGLDGPTGAAARQYLERRALSKDDSRRFEIGWAAVGWDGLVRALRKKGFNDSQMAESGLTAQGRDGNMYDRFRGRVMFPIRSVTGRLIGFGGRILDGDGAKYLNSPESRLFNKRHNLYLLDKAKSEMNTKGCAILVEGYMDAIRAHLCGYKNTVASLGTALTNEQASLIKRMTGMCYVCYDSDSAGQEAALRSMYVLQSEGVAAKRVIWTGGKDPDEILQLPDGSKMFDKAIKEALPLPLFHAALRRADLSDSIKAPEARADLLNGMASLSVFDVMPYLEPLSAALGVFPHELQAMIDGHRDKAQNNKYSDNKIQYTEIRNGYENENEITRFGDDLEYMFCSLLWSKKEIRSEYNAEEVMKYISDPAVQSIVYALLNGEDPQEMEKRWQVMGDRSGMSVIARGDGLLAKEGINEETSAKLIETMRRKYLERQISACVKKIKDGSISDAEYDKYMTMNRLLKGGNNRA